MGWWWEEERGEGAVRRHATWLRGGLSQQQRVVFSHVVGGHRRTVAEGQHVQDHWRFTGTQNKCSANLPAGRILLVRSGACARRWWRCSCSGAAASVVVGPCGLLRRRRMKCLNRGGMCGNISRGGQTDTENYNEAQGASRNGGRPFRCQSVQVPAARQFERHHSNTEKPISDSQVLKNRHKLPNAKRERHC